MQRIFIESVIGSYRRGVLDLYVFCNLTKVRNRPDRQLHDYSEGMHDSAPDRRASVEH